MTGLTRSGTALKDALKVYQYDNSGRQRVRLRSHWYGYESECERSLRV